MVAYVCECGRRQWVWMCACAVDTNSTSTFYPSLLFVVATAADVCTCTCIHPLEPARVYQEKKYVFFWRKKERKRMVNNYIWLFAVSLGRYGIHQTVRQV